MTASTAPHRQPDSSDVRPHASERPSGAPEESRLDALKARILANRGASYPEVYAPGNLIPPQNLTDGEKAAHRLARALILHERITAVADFDSDGATACAVFIKGMNMLADALTPPRTKPAIARKSSNPVADTPNADRLLGNKMSSKRASLDYVIPDRFRYGYGLKPALAEEQILPLRPDVIVTLDNGISSHDAVNVISQWRDVSSASVHRGEAGAPDVIITDHHAQGDTLPDAYAVVNPNREDCTFESKALCGCGVAFYILLLVRRALIQIIGNAPNRAGVLKAVANVQMNHLSDLVAVGTIGDLVPMDANNRLLVKVGLDRINRGLNMPARQAHEEGYLSYGLRALIEVAKITPPVTASDLAFQCVPRLNAVGRLEVPTAGIECLLAQTQRLAEMEARRCHTLNEERKKVQRDMEVQANEALNRALSQAISLSAEQAALEEDGSGDPATPDSVVLFDESWHQGIVGLVASRIKERTGGAVVCFAPEGDPNADQDDQDAQGDPDWLKGSCRSDNVHIRDALAHVASQAPDLLMQFGGHARAAGLSLHRTDLNRFTTLLKKAVAHGLATAPLHNPVFDDGELDPNLRTFKLAQWIERQPWGQLFPEPTFTQAFHVAKVSPVGQRHQKLFLRDPSLSSHASLDDCFEVLWFFSLPEAPNPGDPLKNSEQPSIQAGDTIKVRYQLSINRFRGANTLQGIARSVTLEEL